MTIAFKKPEKRSRLTGETAVYFDNQDGGQVLATPSGIEVQGTLLIEDWEADGVELACVLTKAWSEHLKLKPKLTSDIPGGIKF